MIFPEQECRSVNLGDDLHVMLHPDKVGYLYMPTSQFKPTVYGRIEEIYYPSLDSYMFATGMSDKIPIFQDSATRRIEPRQVLRSAFKILD